MNYHNEMLKIIETLTGKPKLLLHSCCAPCSSYVITFLKDYFDITLLYYNPNIEPKAEYDKRKQEQIKLCELLNVEIVDCDYDNLKYKKLITGLKNEPEGGLRCSKCFKLRLVKAGAVAELNGYDYFGTTLTVSPHKNTNLINKIGKDLENIYKVKFLYSDFKKKDGYKKSIELTKKYDLYRQDYCGCMYSKMKG